jgi:hypothetical protein
MFSVRFFSIALPYVLAGTVGVRVAHADIYTWTDASGRVNVSNLAPPEGARVSHVVHETPPPVAAVNDSTREAARQAELRALSERVRQLEAEANAAQTAVPPDLMYPRVAASGPPPSVQYNVTVLPSAPQYNAEAPPQNYPSCDPAWAGCWPWWGATFYPAPAFVNKRPNFHRGQPFRGEHPFHGQHHVTATSPTPRMPGHSRRG